VFAAETLDQVDAWQPGEREAFLAWVKRVLLPASAIKNRNNNWACWGIMASLASNRILQREKAFTQDVQRLKQILDAQIEPDGSMPHELKRGKKSLWYTYFGLAPLSAAVEMVRNASEEDLFSYEPPSEGSLRDAISFFYEKGIKDQSSWPVKVDDPVDASGKHGVFLFAMGRIYQNPEWMAVAEHPTWRDRGGLAWICPSLLQPAPSRSP